MVPQNRPRPTHSKPYALLICHHIPSCDILKLVLEKASLNSLRIATNKLHHIQLAGHCLPYLRQLKTINQYIYISPWRWQLNVWRNVGQLLTFDTACPRKPKFYFSFNLLQCLQINKFIEDALYSLLIFTWLAWIKIALESVIPCKMGGGDI
jgi:hypothetical protein